MTNLYPTFLAALFLALVHVFGRVLGILDVMPRSRWMSAGSGIAAAFVFMHLLPKLSEHQEVLDEATGSALDFVEHHAYLVALLGMAAFYGLERGAQMSRKSSEKDTASGAIFWISVGVFTWYNTLIGYLLLDEAQSGLRNLLVFTVAMALHFVANDYALREHYRELYVRYGRWLLSSAVAAGTVLGMLGAIPSPALSTMVAFLTGGIILNVLKEELPQERESSFTAFAIGAAAYAGLTVLH